MNAEARAVDGLRRALGAGHDGLAVAPGRVNLIGEHTDYNGGLVLPIAIDRVCAAAWAAGDAQGRVRAVAVDLDERAEIDASRPIEADAAARGMWRAYVRGVVEQMRRAAGGRAARSVDLAIASDVPMGGGLSSSAALEVAVAMALRAAWGIGLDDMGLALACQRAEHEHAGVPCGVMDQLASVFGREGHAILIDCRAMTLEAVPMLRAEEVSIVVIDSGVRHALASGVYADRRRSCERAAAALGLASLRDAEPGGASDARVAEADRPRVRHVVGEIERVRAAASALRAGDARGFGRLMRASHESLRDDYRVSCAELDAIAEVASGVPGVHGCRLTGGGFGGCAVALVEAGAAGALRDALDRELPARIGRRCAAMEVRAAAGARVTRAGGAT